MHDQHDDQKEEPADLLKDYLELFTEKTLPGPVLDVASGDCRNGIFLAQQGLQVTCIDISAEALAKGQERAHRLGVAIETRQMELEGEDKDPFIAATYGGILVFRYLYRPIIPNLKRALKEGGVLVYETYTIEQPRFGKPRNPNFLLNPGELRNWFSTWDIVYYFEGVRHDPRRAIAQIVCRKPVFNKLSREDREASYE